MPLFRCLIKDGAEFPANTNPVGAECSCLFWSCLGCVVSVEFVLMGHFSLSRLAGAAAVRTVSSALCRGMASSDVVVKEENQVLSLRIGCVSSHWVPVWDLQFLLTLF